MKKRGLALLLAVVLTVSLTACGGAQAERKTFTLSVSVHDTVTTHTITSARETLGEALLDEGLIAGEDGPYGLYVKTVDGVSVDDAKKEWWCLTKGGAVVNTGVDTTALEDGATYELTLTVGD